MIADITTKISPLVESYTKELVYEDLVAEWSEMDAIPTEWLIPIGVEHMKRDSENKAMAILRGVSGITSTVSSSVMISMILRSDKGLSTTHHRLLLGLCISDIFHSVAVSNFNATAPSEVSYYVWNARGNQATCTLQGFFVTLGTTAGLFYNCSLNLYYLAVVKYGKSNEFIRSKIEPFLHAIPIFIALSYSVALLAKGHYNDEGGMCILPVYIPIHCIGYELGEVREGFDIPCWRGIEGAWTARLSRSVLIFVPAAIMMISLGMIYRKAKMQEKKLSRYGVGALRANMNIHRNIQQQSTNNDLRAQHQHQQDIHMYSTQASSIWGRVGTSLRTMRTSVTSIMAPSFSFVVKRKKPAVITRSNSGAQSQSRAVMRKALAYSFAWLLSYGFLLVLRITELFTMTFSNKHILGYIASTFVPLQGLFNLLIFMLPKVIGAKKSKREDVSWCQAFTKVLFSKASGSGNVSGSGGSSRMMKKKKRRRRQQQQQQQQLQQQQQQQQGPRKTKLRTTGNGRPWKTQNATRMQRDWKRIDSTSSRTPPKRGRSQLDAVLVPHEEEKCEIQTPDSHVMSARRQTVSMYAPNVAPMSMSRNTCVQQSLGRDEQEVSDEYNSIDIMRYYQENSTTSLAQAGEEHEEIASEAFVKGNTMSDDGKNQNYKEKDVHDDAQQGLRSQGVSFSCKEDNVDDNRDEDGSNVE